MLKKKIMESIFVAALATGLTVGSLFGGVSANAIEVKAAEKETSIVVSNTDIYAGFVVEMEDVEISVEAEPLTRVSVAEPTAEKNAGTEVLDSGTVDIVTEGLNAGLSAETLSDTVAIVSEVEAPPTAEELQWQANLMARVEDSLNVRSEANEESAIVGKIAKGDVATIREKGDVWTKISSGNVEGYVLNEYCVTGTEALMYAKQTVDTIAVVTTDGLRIRGEQSTEGSVIDVVATGYELVVDNDAEMSSGWVAVKFEGKTGFVSADHVTLSLDLGKALTVEEIAKIEAEKAAEKQRRAAAEAAAQAKQKSGGSSVQTEAVSVSYDDVTLLAAIIMCEAGNCSYDGQLAVGSVVVNRMKSGSYPGSVEGVIYQRGQFGPASSGKLARVLESGKISSSARNAAEAALGGQDNTDGAIGFAYASSGRAGVVYGSVVFFK